MRFCTQGQSFTQGTPDLVVSSGQRIKHAENTVFYCNTIVRTMGCVIIRFTRGAILKLCVRMERNGMEWYGMKQSKKTPPGISLLLFRASIILIIIILVILM